MKTLDECLRTLVTCAGGDGNLLLNVGPMPDGQIEPRQADRLREMGAWLRTHGRSIYDTRGGPFLPGGWGASTHRGRNVFLHLFPAPDATLRLPSIPARIVSARVLNGPRVEATQTAGGLEIGVPLTARQSGVTVVELRLDRDAAGIPPT
jgi:alpha-L-fucosidase